MCAASSRGPSIRRAHGRFGRRPRPSVPGQRQAAACRCRSLPSPPRVRGSGSDPPEAERDQADERGAGEREGDEEGQERDRIRGVAVDDLAAGASHLAQLDELVRTDPLAVSDLPEIAPEPDRRRVGKTGRTGARRRLGEDVESPAYSAYPEPRFGTARSIPGSRSHAVRCRVRRTRWGRLRSSAPGRRSRRRKRCSGERFARAPAG